MAFRSNYQKVLKKGYVKIIGFYPQISFEVVPPKDRLDVAIFALDPVQDVEGVDFSSESRRLFAYQSGANLIPKQFLLKPRRLPIISTV